MKPDIVIHDPADSVGVAVVEGIEAGQELAVWIMDTNENTSRRQGPDSAWSQDRHGRSRRRRHVHQVRL